MVQDTNEIHYIVEELIGMWTKDTMFPRMSYPKGHIIKKNRLEDVLTKHRSEDKAETIGMYLLEIL